MADQQAPELTSLLAESSIRLDEKAASRDEAIRAAGQALIEAGAVRVSLVVAARALLRSSQRAYTRPGPRPGLWLPGDDPR